MQLSAKEKSDLENRARKTRNVHERLRLCVILARSEGMSPDSIAQAHRIAIASVYRYLTEYDELTKTNHDPKGGSESKLNKIQTHELLEHLQIFTYFHAKQICRYVKERYNSTYSVSGITSWLKDHGFTYKEPLKVPGKLDPQRQQDFIESYMSLKTGLGRGEKIYFLDAVHPEFQSQAVSGWIKKGEVKTLPTTNKQFRMHFVGALSLDNMEVFAREYDTIDADSVINFLKDLEKSSCAKSIHIICDNGRSNKNKKINEFLIASKIKIHYLPPYSPNLNPIERLWKVMREKKTYNKCYEKFIDFSEAIRTFFFEEIPEIKEQLGKRINDNFQKITINHINCPSR